MYKKGIISILLSFNVAWACKINGDVGSGICYYDYLPAWNNGSRDLAEKRWNCNDDERCMPFCGKWIAEYYPPCIPSIQKIVKKDRNFPHGRFYEHSTFRKDQWVQRQVEQIFEESQRKQGYFYNNEDCRNAFERYMCWVNFPRCDERSEESLPMCESVCKNYLKVCGYDYSLQQCSSDRNIQESLYFPGQLFVQNDEKKQICTPSIKGSSRGTVGLEEKRLTCVLFVLITFLIS